MNTPALDPAALAELNAIGPNLVSDLAAMFLDETPPTLAALRTAVAAGDSPAIHRLARDLKESSAVFGATRLTDLCRLGVYTRDLPTWLRRVEAEYARVAAALEAVA